MAKAKTHEHIWVEFRRQVPWTEADFDPDRLAPERARDVEGKPHSDKQHAEKVAVPKPEINFKCYGCDSVKTFVIPAARYKAIVAALESGELTDSRFAESTGTIRPNDITLVPLQVLCPEALGELTEPPDAVSTGPVREIDRQLFTVLGLEGETAHEADARFRELVGLPPLAYPIEAHPKDRAAK